MSASMQPSSGAASQSKKVVIVGAGLAGLAAAHTLSTAHSDVQFDIKLLEAKPYPGGRVRSVPIQNGKSFAEVGAYFLYYFEEATSFTNFLESRNLASDKTTDTHNEIFTDTGIPNVHLLSNGEEIEFSSAKHYEKIFAEILEELSECYDREDWNYVIQQEWPKKNMTWLQLGNDNVSPKEYLEVRYFEAVQNSADLPLPTGCTPRHIYNRMVTYERFMNGTYLSNLDVSSYGESLDPDCEYLHRANYSEIVAAISDELPPDTLQCSSVVTAINWTDKAPSNDKLVAPITVLCENDQKYEADHVIITTSLGVLKMWASDDTFTPSLPTDKVDAISKLGMGEGCSVCCEFSAPLIDREHNVIELFWREEDLDYTAEYPWLQSIDALIRQCSTNAYGFWLSGEKAKGFEAASEFDRLQGIALVLKTFFKKTVTPLSVICGSWTSDPHTRGTYSYCANGSCKKDRVTLSKPVDGFTPLQLLFAGEATHPTIFSTTNGAFETGVQQANLLLDKY